MAAKDSKVVKKRIDNFVYNDENVIGKGQFGYVYQGYDVRTNEVVAIKVIPVSILENKFFEYLLINEIGALKKLNTPYIVRFIDLKLTMHNIYLITEFCNGGDLSGLLTKRGRLPEDEVCDILWQVAEAFKSMKEFNMLHRDLKPPNILINEGTIKIADLGFSKTVENFQGSISNSTVGSPIYMSPQVLFKQTYTSKCDIWSLGIMLYQLLYGKVPWHALDIVELANKIKNEPIIFTAGIPISPELKDFIVRCLRYEEAERISWDDLFEHPAVKKSKFGKEQEAKKKGGTMQVENSPDVQEITKNQAANGTNSQMVDEAELAKIKAQSIYEDPVNKKPLTTVIRPEEVNKAPVSQPGQDEAVYTRNVKDKDFVTNADVIPDPKLGGGQQPNQGARGGGGQRGGGGGGGGYQPGQGMMPGMPGMPGMHGMYPGMQPGFMGMMPGQGMQGMPGQGMGMPGMGMGGYPPGYGGGRPGPQQQQQQQMPQNRGGGGNMGPGGFMGQQMPQQQQMGQMGPQQGRGQQPMYPPYGGGQQQQFYGGGIPNGWGPYHQ